MDSLTEASTYFKQIGTLVKQFALNLSDLEVLVEEATNNDNWGPTSAQMQDICSAAYDPEGYRQIMGVLGRRLQEQHEEWRKCYKGLLVLDYMVKNGPQRVANDIRRQLKVIEALQSHHYCDVKRRDCAQTVKTRAEQLVNLVTCEATVREEREKAAKNRAKYGGVSSEEAKYGRFKQNYYQEDSDWRIKDNSASKYNHHSERGASTSPRKNQLNDPDNDIDPFEATRQRIEKLKVEGVAENFARFESAPDCEINSPVIEVKQPKQLSTVQINQNIANSLDISRFGGTSTSHASSKPSGNASLTNDLISTAPVSAPTTDLLHPTTDLLSQTTPVATFDFLSDVGPTTAPSNPTPPPKPAGDDWGAFESTAPQSAPVDPFATLAGTTTHPTPAPISTQTPTLGTTTQPARGTPTAQAGPGTPSRQPLPADLFLDVPESVKKAHAAAMAAATSGAGGQGGGVGMAPGVGVGVGGGAVGGMGMGVGVGAVGGGQMPPGVNPQQHIQTQQQQLAMMQQQMMAMQQQIAQQQAALAVEQSAPGALPAAQFTMGGVQGGYGASGLGVGGSVSKGGVGSGGGGEQKKLGEQKDDLFSDLKAF